MADKHELGSPVSVGEYIARETSKKTSVACFRYHGGCYFAMGRFSSWSLRSQRELDH